MDLTLAFLLVGLFLSPSFAWLGVDEVVKFPPNFGLIGTRLEVPNVGLSAGCMGVCVWLLVGWSAAGSLSKFRCSFAENDGVMDRLAGLNTGTTLVTCDDCGSVARFLAL